MRLFVTILFALLLAASLDGQARRSFTSAAGLFPVQTTWTDPCPPEPEPFPRAPPPLEAMYVGVFTAGGALLGGAITRDRLPGAPA